jgi:hypothetical protein
VPVVVWCDSNAVRIDYKGYCYEIFNFKKTFISVLKIVPELLNLNRRINIVFVSFKVRAHASISAIE